MLKLEQLIGSIIMHEMINSRRVKKKKDLANVSTHNIDGEDVKVTLLLRKLNGSSSIEKKV